MKIVIETFLRNSMKNYQVIVVGFMILYVANIVGNSRDFNVITIGTSYAGQTIPSNLLDENSIVYCVGAGEDISFDLGVIHKYGCRVYTMDPTEKAIKHIEYIKQQVEKGLTAYNKVHHCPVEPYLVTHRDLSFFTFLPIGIWKNDEICKFYLPRNREHTSESITNLQKTNEYVELPCKRLSTVMKELGHNCITLLKIDIEGAEYAVLDSIFEDEIDIKCICLEWDELAGVHLQLNDDIEGTKRRIAGYLNKLHARGYKVIDERHNAKNIVLLRS